MLPSKSKLEKSIPEEELTEEQELRQVMDEIESGSSAIWVVKNIYNQWLFKEQDECICSVQCGKYCTQILQTTDVAGISSEKYATIKYFQGI